MKEFINKKFEKIKLECKQLKNKIKETTASKLFWCELIIIVAILMFVITNFIFNLIFGMYILSFVLFAIAIFIWKCL